MERFYLWTGRRTGGKGPDGKWQGGETLFTLDFEHINLANYAPYLAWSLREQGIPFFFEWE